MATQNKKNRFNNTKCDNAMTFQDCELAILRQAVDENEEAVGEKMANSEDVKAIIKILETFLVRKKCICYGGTAINNILPKYAQFYNRDIEIPDYDFFSNRALDDAKELADIYAANGYEDVEVRSGIHKETYKVFVNFIPIADITQLHKNIFKTIYKEAITINGIKFAPPNFLRMNMYLELSRPAGDVSRWEKVLKRLNLLNKYKKHFIIKIYINKIIKLNSERINFLAEKSKGDILFSVSDDMIIKTKNWDILIDIESSKFENNSPYCLWPSVDANKYKFLHCAFPIISRKWFDILKYHSYPKFYHFYTDTWICELSKLSGKFLLLKKLFIKTFHPEINKKYADKTYFRLRKNSKNYNDKIIFYRHENIRKVHAQKLKKNYILS